MPLLPVGPCMPDPPDRDLSPEGQLCRPIVVVVIIVVTFSFAGLVLTLGYDLRAALTDAVAAGVVAVEVARRALALRQR